MIRIYFAGWEEEAEVEYESLLDVLQFRMISYYKMKSLKKSDLFFKKFRPRYKSLILDSGAFSAWRSGAAINFEDYLQYCKLHYNDFNHFVSLDQIPNNPNDPLNVEAATNRSWNRYEDMVGFFENNNMDPERIIPVYHQFETLDNLEKMLQANIPYIGLLPSNENFV